MRMYHIQGQIQDFFGGVSKQGRSHYARHKVPRRVGKGGRYPSFSVEEKWKSHNTQMSGDWFSVCTDC